MRSGRSADRGALPRSIRHLRVTRAVRSTEYPSGERRVAISENTQRELLLVADSEDNAACIRLVQEPERLQDDRIAELVRGRERLVERRDAACGRERDTGTLRGTPGLRSIPSPRNGIVCGRWKLGNAGRLLLGALDEPRERCRRRPRSRRRPAPVPPGRPRAAGPRGYMVWTTSGRPASARSAVPSPSASPSLRPRTRRRTRRSRRNTPSRARRPPRPSRA